MKLQSLALGCALAMTGSAAFAADVVTAKPQRPLSEPIRVIAGGAIFACAADSCVAAAPTSETYAPAACKALVATVGPLASFGSVRRKFDPQRLAGCNAAAK